MRKEVVTETVDLRAGNQAVASRYGEWGSVFGDRIIATASPDRLLLIRRRLTFAARVIA